MDPHFSQPSRHGPVAFNAELSYLFQVVQKKLSAAFLRRLLISREQGLIQLAFCFLENNGETIRGLESALQQAFEFPDAYLSLQAAFRLDQINPVAWRLSSTDVCDFDSLEQSIKKYPRKLDRRFSLLLPLEWKQMLFGPRSKDYKIPEDLLLKLLNHALFLPNLYRDLNFQEITLSPETQDLLSRRPHGPDLMRLHRMLLQDAYPSAIRLKGE